MKPIALLGAALLLALAAAPGVARAYELEHGLNNAGVVAFPTALDQPVTHTVAGTIELTDIAKPDLNGSNLRYGYQLGSFQLLADLNWTVAPVHQFDYGELKAKLHVLSLDEFRSYFAVGLLGRWVEKSEERPYRIDDRPASLFGIYTVELFPIDAWGGILCNFYLDNRFFSTGFKTQLYPQVQLVAEAAYLHSTQRKNRLSGRGGLEIAGDQNFYFQLLYSDVGARWFVQVGTGF